MHTNLLVNKFCNLLMRSGNKTKALSLFSQGFTQFLKSNSGTNLNVPQVSKKNMPLEMQRYVQVKDPVFHELSALPARTQHTTKVHTIPGQPLKEEQSQGKLVGTKQSNISPENMLHTLTENVRPCIEIRKVRVARATYQVPAQISKSKGQTLALRWIIEFAHKRRQREKISFALALAQELYLAYNKQGGARQRRSELHRLAEANRSSIRYRWW